MSPLAIFGRFTRLAALLAMGLPLSLAAEVASGAAGQSGSARLEFVIHVPEILRLTVVEQPERLAVSAQDIARGFIEARAELEVTSNSQTGFNLRFETLGSHVAGGNIAGLALPISLEAGAGQAHLTHRGRQDKRVRYALAYRLRLASGLAPGIYPWPVRVAVSS